jgi:arylsulfatase
MSEIAGISPPTDIDGISFAPTLLGRGRQRQHEFLYWEFPEYGGWQAVRWGSWKGIRRDIQSGNRGMELYDLKADPREQKNVAAQHPEIVARIAEIMAREHVTSSVESFRLPNLDRD